MSSFSNARSRSDLKTSVSREQCVSVSKSQSEIQGSRSRNYSDDDFYDFAAYMQHSRASVPKNAAEINELRE